MKVAAEWHVTRETPDSSQKRLVGFHEVTKTRTLAAQVVAKWHVTRENPDSTQKRYVGVHQLTKTTTLAAQVAQIHKMMKNMMTP